jgi:hypothetical protein
MQNARHQERRPTRRSCAPAAFQTAPSRVTSRPPYLKQAPESGMCSMNLSIGVYLVYVRYKHQLWRGRIKLNWPKTLPKKARCLKKLCQTGQATWKTWELLNWIKFEPSWKLKRTAGPLTPPPAKRERNWRQDAQKQQEGKTKPTRWLKTQRKKKGSHSASCFKTV